ncbi:MAG: hypothetical protein GWO20_17500 [Candidatus Korarchaeota archaeon]|nr:hypothetical protein [Candidatus Korarchaeota archaeon]NIU85054.1 hypothetical protein [Candidatus Thorarchaeota archaeon]NIW15194.1 hypothetical protein [Candidatus Thorarchaeota archaeon]NIW53106.1 hypothetical protein [Candidatus Korarchaeota archaeon]
MFYFNDNDIVVPGDVIGEGKNLRAGEGVYKENREIIAEKVGMLSLKGSSVKVIPLKGFYAPSKGDFVIGFIISSSLTSWDVYIRSTYPARLNASDFLGRRVDVEKEDISKHLSKGDVIYGKIERVNRYGSSNITTRDSKFLGKLEEGHIVTIKPPRVPRVIGRKLSMLSILRKEAKVLVGDNGFIYIKTDSLKKFKVLREAIKMIEEEAFVSGLTGRVKEFISEKLG